MRVASLAWNPDGKRIASWDEKGNIFVWELHTTEPVTQTKGVRYSGRYGNHSDGLIVPRWSPQGEHLAVMTEKGVNLLAANGDGEILISLADEAPRHAILWRLDGAIVVGGTAYSTDGKEIEKLDNWPSRFSDGIWLDHGERFVAVRNVSLGGGATTWKASIWNKSGAKRTEIVLPQSVATDYRGFGTTSQPVSPSGKHVAVSLNQLASGQFGKFGRDIAVIDTTANELAWTGLG